MTKFPVALIGMIVASNIIDKLNDTMKKSKITKSNAMDKIIKMISRNEQMERNGGGQWVATHRVHKSKKQYSRRRFKQETKQELD